MKAVSCVHGTLEVVGVILGMQVRSADSAPQHIQHELPLGGLRFRQVDHLEGAAHATDSFHSAIVAR